MPRLTEKLKCALNYEGNYVDGRTKNAFLFFLYILTIKTLY